MFKYVFTNFFKKKFLITVKTTYVEPNISF